MSQRAEELIGQLVDRIEVLETSLRPGATHYEDCWKHHDSCAVIRDARAYLARERGPVVEADIVVSRHPRFGWQADQLADAMSGNNVATVRFEVPAHIVNPPILEGEVAEGDARTALEPEER